MKILKLLNKKYFSILLIVLIGFTSSAEEQPVDIWNIENKKINDTSKAENEEKDNSTDETNIYNMQSQKKTDTIEQLENLNTKDIKIFGLYDPEDHGLDLNMWSNSDGDQLKNLITKLNSMKLSEDATEIVNISLLTNAYSPKKNISEKEFLKFKSDWLIKNSNLVLIEEYLIKNQIMNLHPKLTKYLVDQYLSNANVEKSCEIFSKNFELLKDDYLSKFNMYCLIYMNQKDEAQIIFDLKKEMGFKDKYFEDKLNYLLGYSSKVDDEISQNSILEFHLAHKTNPNFSFEPNDSTDKLIWRYLSSSNLLLSMKKIETSELEKISVLEKATHNKNYSETDLFEVYKRFQFNINQLLNAEATYKSLSNIEARALIYQKVLLESEMIERLKHLKILKNLFKNDNIGDAFDIELKKFLAEINPTEVPDNLTSFYYTNIKINNNRVDQIKFNNDVLHQSKLINYFNGDFSKSKIEKDVNNFLKKIKKNKKYFFSKKDIMLIESLKSDGIKIQDKFADLYKLNKDEMPSDIQVMINNNEKGMALLRIVEVIGQDELEKIDEDTIYFIINTLNQLNIDFLRNKILFKILPLKV